MTYYNRFSPDVLHKLKELNDKLIKEENETTPDKDKILKIKQQILMKGLEMSVGYTIGNYNPYIF